MRIDREYFIRFAVAVALACYDLPKFSFYIYYQDKLKTLDEWIRETDLSESFYFGGTLDYHF